MPVDHRTAGDGPLPVTAASARSVWTRRRAIARVGGLGIESVGMDANEPGLFDLPTLERPGTASPAVRGRNRQTGVRTVTAEFTLIDAGALHEAAAHAAENAVTIGLRADADVEGTALGSSDVVPSGNAFDALGWLLWPTAGMEGPLEAGAFRVLSEAGEAVAESVDRGTVTWTVTVKLTDVDGPRRLAAGAHPDAAGLIVDSLAVAWQYAAEPFGPLRSIPGIAWRPGPVDVEHLPAKTVGHR